MVEKGFGEGCAAFEAAEALHRVVPLLHQVFQLLALVAEAGLVLAVARRGDVHPIRRVEHLGLRAAHHLEVVEFEAAVEPAPGVQHQDTADGVVSMAVNGPVGDDYVGVFAVDQFAHLAMALEVHLGVAVDLVHK